MILVTVLGRERMVLQAISCLVGVGISTPSVDIAPCTTYPALFSLFLAFSVKFEALLAQPQVQSQVNTNLLVQLHRLR